MKGQLREDLLQSKCQINVQIQGKCRKGPDILVEGTDGMEKLVSIYHADGHQSDVDFDLENIMDCCDTLDVGCKIMSEWEHVLKTWLHWTQTRRMW